MTPKDRQNLIDAIRHPQTVVGLALKDALVKVIEENGALEARLEKLELESLALAQCIEQVNDLADSLERMRDRVTHS